MQGCHRFKTTSNVTIHHAVESKHWLGREDVKVKVKFALEETMKAQRGVEV